MRGEARPRPQQTVYSHKESTETHADVQGQKRCHEAAIQSLFEREPQQGLLSIENNQARTGGQKVQSVQAYLAQSRLILLRTGPLQSSEGLNFLQVDANVFTRATYES